MSNGIILAMLFYLCGASTYLLCSHPTTKLKETLSRLEWQNRTKDLLIKSLRAEEASVIETLENYIDSLKELEVEEKLNDFHRGSLFAYERALKLWNFEEEEQFN